MNKLREDIRRLRECLQGAVDLHSVKFHSPEVVELAADLSHRNSRLDSIRTYQSRKIKTASDSLSRARLEKKQIKSSLAELQKIMDLGQVISTSRDMEDILSSLLSLLKDVLPSRGCGVFMIRGGAVDPVPVASSNLGNDLQVHVNRQLEEGIIEWSLREKRVCLIPNSEGEDQGDFAIVPLNDGDSSIGFVWIACTIRQADMTQEALNLIWVLASHTSVAILNCLHRRHMQDKLDELKLLTTITTLKGEVLQKGSAPGQRAKATEKESNLNTFFHGLSRVLRVELKLPACLLVYSGHGGLKWDNSVEGLSDVASLYSHPEFQKMTQMVDREQFLIATPGNFTGSFPHLAGIFGSEGLLGLPLAGGEDLSAYLLAGISKGDIGRLDSMQPFLSALVSQVRVVVENLSLYDSLLAANGNLTSLQFQLVHSGKMAALGQLAGGVAHEINNPLQIMLGRIQMGLLMTGEGKLHEELNLIQGEILRIRDIVRNLLDFSRQGKKETALAPVSINGIFSEVVALLHHQLMSEKVEVRTSFDSAEPQVLGNRNQIKQVLINLLMNALHAMEKDLKVLELQTVIETDLVVISIRDNGIGISSENIQKVFEPFFTTKNMGTGLGLSITYGLIQEHKGTIEVESRENRGSCFTIRFPRLSYDALSPTMLVG